MRRLPGGLPPINRCPASAPISCRCFIITLATTIPAYLPCIMDANCQQSILFLDKVFLRPRKQNLRGVELFNLNLVRDLARESIRLIIPIHHSWKSAVMDGLSGRLPSFAGKHYDLTQGESAVAPKEPCHDKMSTLASEGSAMKPCSLLRGIASPEFCEVGRGSTPLNGLLAAWRLRRRSFDKIILANIANSLIPALWLLRMFRGRRPLVLFAHRLPQRRFLAALPWRAEKAVPVNSLIAARFRKAGYPGIHEIFGHIDAGRYYPADSRPAPDKINFCVIGFLDNAWKGADTAVAAFRKMPEEVRFKSVLHLAAFRSPPSFPEANIRAPAWMPSGRMPEWLRGMDVMIVPSRDEGVMRETFSLTMVEGMLTGLPIIVSNLPVLAEKISAGGGYVFRTIDDLARLMTILARDEGLRARLGAQARASALARYVWDTKRFIRLCLA